MRMLKEQDRYVFVYNVGPLKVYLVYINISRSIKTFEELLNSVSL